MAKRFKFDSTNNDSSSAVAKALEVKDLMTNADADKLIELEKEMKSILDARELTSEEKVKKFEQALAKFRDVQERIIKNGGVSLIDEHVKLNESDKKEFRDMIENVVREIIGSKNVSEAVEPKKQIEPKTPASRKTTKEKQVEIVATPAKVSKSDDPVNVWSAGQGGFVELLQKKGLTFNDSKAIFPVSSDQTGFSKKSVKEQEKKFAKRTFKSALDYVLAPTKIQSPPARTGGAIAAIYSTVQKSENIDDLVKKYPNLAKIHGEAQSPAAVMKWAQLH